MCVCVRAHVYAYMHFCMYICTHIPMHIYTYTHIHTHICIYIYKSLSLFIYLPTTYFHLFIYLPTYLSDLLQELDLTQLWELLRLCKAAFI